MAGRSYTSKVKIGNWYEQRELEQIRLRDVLERKERGEFNMSNLSQRRQLNLKPVENVSTTPDGVVRLGDVCMMYNLLTEGYLATNLSDKLTMTTTWIASPCARNTFQVVRYQDKNDILPVAVPDDVLRYGQKIQFVSNPELAGGPYYVQSQRTSHSSYAKYSKHQELDMTAKSVWNTVWQVVFPDPQYRDEMEGAPVKIHVPVLLRHCNTNQYMATDKIAYRNEFGSEWEASVHTHLDGHKAEKTQNLFVFVLKEGDAHLSISQTAPAEQAVDLEALQTLIRETLKTRGAHGIRGLGRSFRIIDDSGDGMLSQAEFATSLREYGIPLTDDEITALMALYDKDGNGKVCYDEFLSGLRGMLNPARQAVVDRAFAIFDKTGDGVVQLDDLQGAYDVSGHPAVIAGEMTPEEAYGEFIANFDVGNRDGVVTKAEFDQYYADISASIDNDEYFELLISRAWKME